MSNLKILFVYLLQEDPLYYVSTRLEYKFQRRPQLGFQYLSAVLKKERGAEVEIYDQAIIHFSLKDFIEKLKKENYLFVGFYSATSMKDKICNYIKKIKEETNVSVVVGGPGFLHGEKYLNVGCDIVCNGEGEETILDIYDYFDKNIPLKKIKGISYKENKIIRNENRPLIQDLDSIPFPDRSKVPIKSYYDYFIPTMRRPYATIMASRGCHFNCTFCTSHVVWGHKYRQRSVRNVIDEIEELVNKYEIKYIAFQDDDFGLNQKWLEELCLEIIKKNYKFKWMCICHPFSFIRKREETLKLLKKSGCDTLSFGLQSADKQILKNIKRNEREPEELLKTIRLAKKFSFFTSIGFIFGLPGDTEETIKTTIDYCDKVKPHVLEFYSLAVLEGSEIHKNYKSKPICGLSREEVNKWCIKASKRFYRDPKTILRFGSYVIRKNPVWALKMMVSLPFLLDRVGLIKNKKLISE